MSVVDFSDYITDRIRDLAGREWVLAEIDAWLAALWHLRGQG